MRSYPTATIGLVIATILTYLNSFGTDFQFDDRATILEDRRLESVTAFLGHVDGMIRPLLKASFALDRWLYGTEPAGYHLLNLLLHCGSGLLLFAILSRVVHVESGSGESGRANGEPDGRSIDRPVSRSAGQPVSRSVVPFWATAFFLLHPIQTETVTYISGRATGMAAFFSLLSFYLFLKADGQSSAGKPFALLYGGALASFCLGLSSKETAVVLPALLALWYIVFGRRSLRFHIPFWVILGLALVGALWHPRYAFLARASLETRSIDENALTQVNAVVYALSLFFSPGRQNFDHDLPVMDSVVQWPVPACLVMLGALLLAALVCLRRAPLFSFGLFWFFVCLLPTNSIIPRYDILSERNLYLPSIGLIFAVVALFTRFALGARGRWATGAVGLVVAALLFAATVDRNRVYSDRVTFWSDAASKSPMKARPHNNLGYALFESGEVDSSIEEFRTALSLDPNSASARENLLRAWTIKQQQRPTAEKSGGK